jgi:transcriptional regulator GlxA family with amidase domain
MKEVALLIYEDAILSAVAGALDLLAGVNRYMETAGRPPAFRLSLVVEKPDFAPLYIPHRGVRYRALKEVKDVDLVIAPAFYGPPDVALEKNQAMISFLSAMNRKGAEVASLCVGSYLLAEAGLLTGRACTSHWNSIADMQRRYPDIKVLPDMVLTDQDGIYTSGGAFSSLNLILYLVEKFYGREAGIWLSKTFSIDMDRVSQAHFAVFNGQRQHEDEEIRRAQTYIEEHYNSVVSVEEIAEQINMSKRNFIRRFKHATKNTPLEYLQRVKIESAKKALEREAHSISNLMYDVGYNDMKTFRKVFKRITGLTPQEYRKKYCRALQYD